MGAVDEQSLLNGIQNELLAGEAQLHTDHEALAANLANEGKLPLEVLQLRAEVAAHFFDVRQKPVEDIHELDGDAASQRSAAEGRTVHAGADGFGSALIGDNDAQGDAAGQGLRG